MGCGATTAGNTNRLGPADGYAPYLKQYFCTLKKITKLSNNAIFAAEEDWAEYVKQRKELSDQIPHLLESSFDHHGMIDGTFDSRAPWIFFTNFTSEESNFCEAIREMAILRGIDDILGEYQRYRSDMSTEQLKLNYKGLLPMLREQLDLLLDDMERDYRRQKRERDSAAYKAIDLNSDYQVQKAEFVKALTPSTPQNDELLKALGFDGRRLHHLLIRSVRAHLETGVSEGYAPFIKQYFSKLKEMTSLSNNAIFAAEEDWAEFVKNRDKLSDQLPPLLESSFDHHGLVDGSYYSHAPWIFFTNFTSGESNFYEAIRELAILRGADGILGEYERYKADMSKEQLKSDFEKLLPTVRSQLDSLLDEMGRDYRNQKRERDIAAYKAMDFNGDYNLEKAEFVAALTPLTSQNDELLKALGFDGGKLQDLLIRTVKAHMVGSARIY